MNIKKWQKMTDEQKTVFMHNVFKVLHIGETFDYAELRKRYEEVQKNYGFSVMGGKKPLLELELVDPVMTAAVSSWLYCKFDDEGNQAVFGETAPLFGYNLETWWGDKTILMKLTSQEKATLASAINIMKNKLGK